MLTTNAITHLANDANGGAFGGAASINGAPAGRRGGGRASVSEAIDAPITRGMISIEGIPLIKPPYGRITAIDLGKGTLVWQIAHGETPDAIKNHRLLKGIKIPRTGQAGILGTLTTKTLVICGDCGLFTDDAGRKGARLRAYDKATGEEKGAVFIPKVQTGATMTYMLGGRQYLVTALGSSNGAELVAFRLTPPPRSLRSGPSKRFATGRKLGGEFAGDFGQPDAVLHQLPGDFQHQHRKGVGGGGKRPLAGMRQIDIAAQGRRIDPPLIENAFAHFLGNRGFGQNRKALAASHQPLDVAVGIDFEHRMQRHIHGRRRLIDQFAQTVAGAVHDQVQRGDLGKSHALRRRHRQDTAAAAEQAEPFGENMLDLHAAGARGREDQRHVEIAAPHPVQHMPAHGFDDAHADAGIFVLGRFQQRHAHQFADRAGHAEADIPGGIFHCAADKFSQVRGLREVGPGGGVKPPSGIGGVTPRVVRSSRGTCNSSSM